MATGKYSDLSSKQECELDVHDLMVLRHEQFEEFKMTLTTLHPDVWGTRVMTARVAELVTMIEENDNFKYEFARGAAFDVTLSSTRRVYARSSEEAILLAQQFIISKHRDVKSAIVNLDTADATVVPTSDSHDCVVTYHALQEGEVS